MTATDDLEKALNAETLRTGTAGENLLKVHRLRDGRPFCGARGEVTEWRRAVSCFDCLTKVDTSPEVEERRKDAWRMRSEGKSFAHIARHRGYDDAVDAELDVEEYERRQGYR
ncbi:hypothetical protein G5C60_46875 [Streptomyces sp. HC44]|uniref:Uncharacterized protein n=1 Tax=Streptomyces scabichelini TaxID=2711217 RepID=A0A6G4VMC6_9ACTN|nr:hypothetical protein [Streptomyces scabichelini]NGO14923.1 hypothetical protein [Streptomyces scabichelini]